MVIVAVKAYDTKEAIANIKPLLRRTPLSSPCRTGLGILRSSRRSTVRTASWVGVTNMGATLFGGRAGVRYAGKGETVIGRLDGRIPVQLRSIREVFNSPG